MNAENPEMEDIQDPENITLIPAEERGAKARCTIRSARIKQEHESDEDGEEMQRTISVTTDLNKVYMMEIPNTSGNESLKIQQISQMNMKQSTLGT